jgi:hypothetical protein
MKLEGRKVASLSRFWPESPREGWANRRRLATWLTS